eukprot:c39841_g1_i1 orf=77-304(-)
MSILLVLYLYFVLASLVPVLFTVDFLFSASHLLGMVLFASSALHTYIVLYCPAFSSQLNLAIAHEDFFLCVLMLV